MDPWHGENCLLSCASGRRAPPLYAAVCPTVRLHLPGRTLEQAPARGGRRIVVGFTGGFLDECHRAPLLLDSGQPSLRTAPVGQRVAGHLPQPGAKAAAVAVQPEG